MRCHSKKEDEQPFGVLVAHELGGVRVAKVAERHLEERGPVQVLRHLKDTRNSMTLYRENSKEHKLPVDPGNTASYRRGRET